MKSIAIIPVSFSDQKLLELIGELLFSKFSFLSKVIKTEEDLSNFFSTDRKQYYSTKILQHFLQSDTSAFDKILLITGVDLYVPILTFVFGEAQLGGRGAIVSSHRLHQEFYGLKRDEKLLKERIIKEVLHELGHTFGLRHCLNWDCVMHASASIEEIDIKGKEFCPLCKEKIG